MLSIPQSKRNQTNKETDKMKIGGREIEFVTVVLVGLCNSDPLLQVFIGMAVFREGEGGQLELRLIDFAPGEEAGSVKNPLKPTFRCRKKGEYYLFFQEFEGGHGVSIDLDKNYGRYSFTTGINHGDSGSSGSLSNGGPELADVLDVLFGFVPAS